MMKSILDRAKGIQLLGLDVDGVLTDGRLYFSAQGDELKAFNILDGHGIKMLQKHGVVVCIITGRKSPLTEKRASDLGIKHLLQGREDKLIALKELSEQLNINFPHIAYVGDDLPDLSAIRASGLGITVPNAHPFVRKHADWTTPSRGGEGAIREVCDMILDAKGLLEDLHETYL
ncbi:KdsC family phosphatase [Oleiphilus messinensis]|nr:HAD hydrolase family protein [Oleiphilus messinensis]